MKTAKIISALIILTLLLLGPPFTFMTMAAEVGTTELSANYLVVPGGETIAKIKVENKDIKLHHFNLQATELPEGFKAYFLLEGKLTETIELNPSDKRLIELHIEAPLKVLKDSGTFKIKFLREDGIESFMPISFTINHDFALEITNGIKKLEIMNGKSTSFDIAVTNTGNKELKTLGLKVDLPYKWSLENVIPDKLTLKPGENGVLKVNVSVPSTQAAGNFVIKIKSFNEDATSSEISIPIKVIASASYAWWVIGLVLVFGVVTILYFRKHGRR
ncbi:MAG TPA: NEW3 domain-containing protein [Ruminiclostridium sp.]